MGGHGYHTGGNKKGEKKVKQDVIQELTVISKKKSRPKGLPKTGGRRKGTKDHLTVIQEKRQAAAEEYKRRWKEPAYDNQGNLIKKDEDFAVDLAFEIFQADDSMNLVQWGFNNQSQFMSMISKRLKVKSEQKSEVVHRWELKIDRTPPPDINIEDYKVDVKQITDDQDYLDYEEE